jgi:hypothetical protein
VWAEEIAREYNEHFYRRFPRCSRLLSVYLIHQVARVERFLQAAKLFLFLAHWKAPARL